MFLLEIYFAGNYRSLNSATWSMGNFDNDGDTDLTDLGLLAGNYESGVAVAMADFQRIVPEPSIIGLAAGLSYIGVHALGRRRKREGLEKKVN